MARLPACIVPCKSFLEVGSLDGVSSSEAGVLQQAHPLHCSIEPPADGGYQAGQLLGRPVCLQEAQLTQLGRSPLCSVLCQLGLILLLLL